MKAYEFPAKVTSEGQFDVPPVFADVLPRGMVVRVIVLINEPRDNLEQIDWARLTSEQFLAGYSEADSIYDSLE